MSMSQFRLLFGLIALTYVFSCKAPSASTQGSDNKPAVTPPPAGGSPSIPSASLPNPNDHLRFPIWWIQENYTTGGLNGGQRPGSPTAVVFQASRSGGDTWTVMARTKGGERLEAVGTYSKVGNNYVIDTPGLFFGVDNDGNWDGSIIYNGERLVKGHGDWSQTYLAKMVGLWSSTSTIDKFHGTLPSDMHKSNDWIWEMERTNDGKTYIIARQRARYPDFSPIKGPTAMDLEKRNNNMDRSYKILVSELGDYIYLEEKSIPNNVPLHLYGTKLKLETGFSNHSSGLFIKIISTHNVHAYYLRETGVVTDKGYPELEYVEMTLQNAGGDSGYLTKKN